MIRTLHDLATLFDGARVESAKIFENSRHPSFCIKGRDGVVLHDSKNARFTWRRFDARRKYHNVEVNDRQQLVTMAKAIGLTFASSY